MTALPEQVDGVIGVDAHRDTLTAAAVTAVGGLLCRRCIKRAIARQLFNLLQRYDRPYVEVGRVA